MMFLFFTNIIIKKKMVFSYHPKGQILVIFLLNFEEAFLVAAEWANLRSLLGLNCVTTDFALPYYWFVLFEYLRV